MSDLEAELAAAQAERAAKAAERAAAQREARLSAELARTKRLMSEDEIFAQLQDKYGADCVRRITTKLGMVVVRAAEPLAHRRFTDETMRSDHPNKKVRESFYDACERFAALCVVHPSRPEFDAMCKKPECSGLVSVAANEAYDLGRPQVEEDEGK